MKGFCYKFFRFILLMGMLAYPVALIVMIVSHWCNPEWAEPILSQNHLIIISAVAIILLVLATLNEGIGLWKRSFAAQDSEPIGGFVVLLNALLCLVGAAVWAYGFYVVFNRFGLIIGLACVSGVYFLASIYLLVILKKADRIYAE